jgi:16S rRNA (cytidine1402-2'-O)-methyltransferase
MLYFVATPIGNLKEITYRAVEVLHAVDCVYAENPRRSLTLFNEYGIKKPVFAYERFTEREKTGEIVAKLLAGQSVAVVSDAGMPLVSDPGSVLLEALIAKNLPYTVVSGPCAAVNAVVLSGLGTESFLTAGFLPAKKSDREAKIARFKDTEATLIFYSAVHDIEKDLLFLYQALGSRRAAVCREISKKFEQVVRFTLGEPPALTQKGEFVIVIEGAPPPSAPQSPSAKS